MDLTGRCAVRGLDGRNSAPARSQHVVAALAGERALASSGRLIDIEPVVLIVAGRRNRKIAIGPPIRRDRDLLEDFSYLSIDRPISPSLVGDFTDIARVEYERAFQQSIVFAFVATVSASDVP